MTEVALLRKKYGVVDHDPNLEWVLVKTVILVAGWNRDATSVFFLLGGGYPSTPPDNFYVPSGLRPANGGSVSNLTPNAITRDGVQWDMYSWHHESGWSPTARPEDGSNLVTFMLEVERRLSEAC